MLKENNMTELENILIFFNERRRRGLSASFLASEAGISAITLRKFLNKEPYRYLSDEQIDKLIPVLVDFGYKPLYSDEQII